MLSSSARQAPAGATWQPPAPPTLLTSQPSASGGGARLISGCGMRRLWQSAATRAGSLARRTTAAGLPDEGPAAGNLVQKFDAILEARAIGKTRPACGPPRGPRSAGISVSRVKSGLRIAGAAVRGRKRPCIRVVEEIGDEGRESRPPRGGGERAPRGGGDQDRAAAL